MSDESSRAVVILLSVFGIVGAWYILRWLAIERSRHRELHAGLVGPKVATLASRKLRGSDVLVGFVTNFFDTLGIGSFAPTTAIFKLQRRMPDEKIPGTLNAGHALPTVAQALIFVAIVTVDRTTLIAMIVASVAGAWLGVGIVSRLPRRAIQIGMGVALLIAALLFVAASLHWMPGGGTALKLDGGTLAAAVFANFFLGALMMLGVGLYAPCLILVSLLGMNPLAAFPIMMGSCALLMPVGAARFVKSEKYDFAAAVGLTLGGIPAVLAAAYLVKSLPIEWLRWLVVVVVIYAALAMLRSAVAARSEGVTTGGG